MRGWIEATSLHYAGSEMRVETRAEALEIRALQRVLNERLEC